jgi:uncharacterized protein YjiS (DUF1127 family)
MNYYSGHAQFAWLGSHLSAASPGHYTLHKAHRNKRSAKDWQLCFESPRKGIIMNVARTLNNWRKYRQTVSELGRMSNRELHDLGIDRGDIRNIARAASL